MMKDMREMNGEIRRDSALLAGLIHMQKCWGQGLRSSNALVLRYDAVRRRNWRPSSKFTRPLALPADHSTLQVLVYWVTHCGTEMQYVAAGVSANLSSVSRSFINISGPSGTREQEEPRYHEVN